MADDMPSRRFLQVGKGARTMKPGVYQTTYGNAAVVTSSKRKAYDLDMGEFIPLSEVTERFLRKTEATDRMMMARAKGDIQ